MTLGKLKHDLRKLSHVYWLSNNRKCQIISTNKTECRVDSRQPAETALFSLLLRMTVLLAVCFTQSWLLWKFIRFQLRRWREFRHEQATRKKATKQALRPLKRDSSKFGPADRTRSTGGKSKANVPTNANVSPNSWPPRKRSP